MEAENKYYEPHQLIEMFLSERDVAKISKASYEFHLKRFFRWVKSQAKDHYHLTKSDILLYKQSLQNENKTQLTISAYLTTLKLFYKWTDENGILSNITTAIRIMKTYRDFKKKSLTVDQSNRFLNNLKSFTLIQKRDRAIANLMLRCGLRVIEVIRVNIEDIQNQNGEISLYIQRKGRVSKDQEIPISPQTFEIIQEYLTSRKDNFQDKDPLFVSHGHHNSNGRLNKHHISILIKSLFKAIGLDDPKYTAHSLRHTTATLLLHNGVPEHEIQLMLGHSSYTITQIYTREKDQKLLFKNNPAKRMDAILK